MKEQEIKIVLKSAPLSEWPKSFQALHKAALAATESAYAPYSRFHVGAAVLLANGEIVSASNQENAAYPSGLCAERVVLFYAGARYPDVAVTAIAVAAVTDGQVVERVSPCGACRQVMLETQMRAGAPVQVLLCGSDSITLVDNVASLLPIGFDGSDLS